MGSDTAASFSVIASNCDEIFMQHRLQFANNLKDLKNLRQQLYSAAEYFESSYDKDDQKELYEDFDYIIDSSKDYVSKALVSTVDHLGSVADKLNKFLDEKANEFYTTNRRFYCIERRINTFQGFVNLEGVSQHSLVPDASKHHKLYNSGGANASNFRKSNLVYRDCVPCPQNDTNKSKQADHPFVKGFQIAVIKPLPPLLRKGDMRSFSSEAPSNPVNLSFTRVLSTKEVGKRSISPRFIFKRSSSVCYEPASPGSSINKDQTASDSQRSTISSCVKPEVVNRERQIISYTKRSKNFLKSLISIHHLRKETTRTNSSSSSR